MAVSEAHTETEIGTVRYCKGTNPLPTLDSADEPHKDETHQTVRMHPESLNYTSFWCPICGSRWIPFVGWK